MSAFNTFTPLAVPATDGTGAASSVAQQGLKTVVVGGTFDAIVTVEAGVNGIFAPVFVVDSPDQVRNMRIVADQVRVTITNFVSGTPTVFVGGDAAANQFGTLAVPAGDGAGAALDTSAFGGDKTFFVGGTFDATVTIQVSEDAAGPWAPIGVVDKTGNFIDSENISRFVRAVVTNFASGTPAVTIGGADLDSGVNPIQSPGSTFIFRPGSGGTGPVVFDTFPALEAAKEARRALGGPLPGGFFTIEIDTSLAPAIAPSLGVGIPYNLEGCRLIGTTKGFQSAITFADGSSVIQLRCIEQNLGLVNANTVTPLDSSLAGGDIISVSFNSNFSSILGGTPVFDMSVLGGGDFVIAVGSEAGNFGFGPAAGLVFGGVLPAAGATLFVSLDALSFLQNTAISGAAGNTLMMAATSMANVAASFPLWLGTVTDPRLDGPPTLAARPYLAAEAIAPFGLFQSTWGRYDVSGGPVAQTLPSISALLASSGLSQPGSMLWVSESSGTVGLTLLPGAGDTLNGGAGPFVVPAGGGAILACDGVSDYKVIACFNPSVATPPGAILQWGNNSIAAGADTRFLSPGFTNQTAPATSNAGFRAPRAMTLMNFRVRHNSTAGNGAAVIYDVNVNGVPATLGLSLVSGAIGDSSDLVTTIVVAAGDLVEVTAAKALSIGAGGIDVMFVCEGL